MIGRKGTGKLCLENFVGKCVLVAVCSRELFLSLTDVVDKVWHSATVGDVGGVMGAGCCGVWRGYLGATRIHTIYELGLGSTGNFHQGMKR